MKDINLPDIQVSYKKFLITASDDFIKYKVSCCAGEFYVDDNIIILSNGEFTKGLLKKYNRTIEKQTCKTISHEIIHWLLFKDLNIKVCAKFDDIAEDLVDYGVY